MSHDSGGAKPGKNESRQNQGTGRETTTPSNSFPDSYVPNDQVPPHSQPGQQGKQNLPFGFCSKSDYLAKTIIFRCILPVGCWYKPTDIQPKVCMRFSHKDLGEWECNVGPGAVEKYLEDGNLWLIRFTYSFRSSVFSKSSNSLQYKYVVLNSMHKNEYEVLHAFDKDTNRLLPIPSDSKSDYCQYDTIIYPESAKPGMFRRGFNYISGGGESNELVIPENHQIRQKCLELFLEPTKQLLINGTFDQTHYDIVTATNDLLHIYNCCYNQRVFVKGDSRGSLNTIPSLKEVMMQWLATIVMEMNTNNDQKFISAISVLVAYDKLKADFWLIPTLPEPVMVTILNTVCKSPSGNEDSLLMSLGGSRDSRWFLQNALKHLFTHFIDTMNYQSTDDCLGAQIVLSLLKVLPLILKVQPSSTNTEYMWNNPLSIVTRLRDLLTTYESSVMKPLLDGIKEYFSTDRILISTVIYLCPENDLQLLCDYVPLNMIVAFLNHKLKGIYSLTKPQVERYLINLLSTIRNKFNSNSFKESDALPFTQFLETVSKLLNASETDRSAIACCAVTVLTYANNQGQERYASNVEKFILDWLARETVIGGSIFGGVRYYTQTNKLVKEDDEFKVWDSLLHYTARHFKDIQSVVEENWMKILHSIIVSRVSKISNNNTLIQLYLNLKTRQSVHQMIIDTITFHGSKALAKELESKKSSWWNYVWNSSSTKEVFDGILKRPFPNNESLKFSNLLKFELWPGFIKIYLEMCSKKRQDMTQEWQQICARALQVFESQLENIMSGKVTANDQALIKSGQEQMIKIAETLSSSNCQVIKCSNSKISSILREKPSKELWGLCNKSDSSAKTIVFRCILPVGCWYKSTDIQPKVCMRFSLSELGEWNHDVGPGVVEKMRDGFILITFTCYFDPLMLSGKKHFQYKYVVLDSMHNKEYEVLFDGGPDANRFLQISSDFNGVYCQYDTIIYPESAKPGSSINSVAIPQNDKMRQICLELFLEPTKQLLINGTFDQTQYDIVTATNDLLHIYNCCYNQRVFVKTGLWLGDPIVKDMMSLKKVMMQWLATIVKEMNTNNDQKFISAISVLVAYDKLKAQSWLIPTLPESVMVTILNTVCKSPSGNEDSLLMSLDRSRDSRLFLENALNHLFTYFIDTRTDNQCTSAIVLSLLKVLPLILKDLSSNTSTKYMWNNPLSIVIRLRDLLTTYKSSVMKPVLDGIKEYFSSDPILISTVIYLCPGNDLQLLSDYVPLNMIVTFLNHKLKGMDSLTEPQVERYLIKPLSAIQKKLNSDSFKESELKLLLDKVSKLLKVSETDRSAIVCCAITVLTYANNQGQESYIKMVEKFICDWIVKGTVIGKDMFGGGKFAGNQTNKLVKEDVEFKVWDSLLHYTARHLNDIQSVVKENWMKILHSIIVSRVSKISNNDVLIQLYLNLKTRQSVHQMIIDTITIHGSKALAKELESKKSSWWEYFCKSLSAEEEVFGGLLKKPFPNSEYLKFSNLLKFELWPGFIRIYLEMCSKKRQDTTQEWQQICAQALQVFESQLENIMSGKCTANDQALIKSGQEQMIKIAETLSSSNCQVIKCSKSKISSILRENPSKELWGLCNKSDHSAKTIIFKCILPVGCWYKSTDIQPKVCMRFSLSELGEWKHDVGPGVVEKMSDGFLQITFTCYFDPLMLSRKKHFQYKYVVLDSMHNNEYEVLFDGGPDANRLLQISSDFNGVYCQYDTIIYPESAKPGSIINSVAIPQNDEMRQICLERFLEPTKQLLINGTFDQTHYDIVTATNDLLHIYNCCYNQRVFVKTGLWLGHSIVKDMMSLKKVMMQWLATIVKEMNTNNDQKFISAISVLVAYDKLKADPWFIPTLPEPVMVTILNTVCKSPSGNEDSLLMSLDRSRDSRLSLQNALNHLFTHFIDTMNAKTSNECTPIVLSLLKVLPLILKVQPSSTNTEYMWSNPLSIIESVRNSLTSKSNFMKPVLDGIKEYFSSDPILISTVIYLCPDNDLPLLCDIPLYMIVAFLNHKLKGMDSLTEPQVNKYLINPLSSMNIKCDSFKKSELSQFTQFLDKVSTLLNASETHRSAIVCCAVTVLTYANNQGEKSYAGMVEKLICDWIGKKSVIGAGGMFGEQFETFLRIETKTLVKEDKEFKVWNSLLQYTEKHFHDIQKEVKESWLKIIRSILVSRVSKISNDKVLIQLFLDLEDRVYLHHLISDVITSLAIKPLEEQFISDQSSVLSYFSKAKSSKTTKVFGSLLNKQYPGFNGDLDFNDLLKLELWPGFIKIYLDVCSRDKNQEEEDWHKICARALEVFQLKCEDIMSGRVTVNDLTSNIKPGEKKLLEIANTISNVPTIKCPKSNAIKSAIQKRVNEHAHFSGFQQKMGLLFGKFARVQEFDVFQSLVLKDTSGDLINTLCVEMNGNYEIVFYTVGSEILPHVDNIYHASKTHHSKYFTNSWDSKFSEAVQNKTPFTFKDFVNHVWTPLISDCSTFMENLKCKNVKLADINTKLRRKYSNKQALTDDLQNVNKVLKMCHKKEYNSTWIEGASIHIHKYWELCAYTSIGKTLIDHVQKTLQLTGDFNALEIISKMEDDSNITLKSINEDIELTAQFLQVYKDDKQKRECFEVFCKCQVTVKWIQNLGKKGDRRNKESSSNDLKNFVDIALATAAGGEGDYNTDRLIHLKTVGSGFGPLIYHLPQTAGFEIWRNRCEEMWGNLEQTTNLPTILSYCESEIEWYKSIHEWHGSVEKTSFGQLKNINEFGNYEIGSIRLKQLSSRSEAINMRLGQPKEGKVSLPQSQYSLNELRDLESKLALIVGPESKKKVEVELFQNTFHTVCRIADVLIELQLNGNTEYIQWRLRFPCCLPGVLKVLLFLAKKMENDLECWLNKVNDERKNIYELNYFTMPQILMLREDLGLFSVEQESIRYNVMNLLYGVSKEVMPGDMRTVIEEMESNHLRKKEQTDGTNTITQQHSEKKSKKKNAHSSNSESSRNIQQTGLEEQDNKTMIDQPNPSITVNDLNTEEKLVHDELKQLEIHELLILFAIEKFRDSDLEDATGWCMDHYEEYSFPESDTNEENTIEENELSSEEEDSSEEESDNIDDSTTQIPAADISQDIAITITKERSEDTPLLEFPSEYDSLIDIIDKPPLDKNHHIVKDLMELSYSLEEAIEAAAQCTTDDASDEAIAYLQNKDKGGPKAKVERETDFLLDKMKLERPDRESRSHMPLSKLGKLLQLLAKKYKAPVSSKRPLPPADVIKVGELNLVVVPPEYVLKTMLSLYMVNHETSNHPLPTHEEVLICTKNTTEEEILLFWKRALGDPERRRIFCLVNAELLLYQVWDKSLYAFQQASLSKTGYRIVVICSNKDEDKSNVISKLQIYRRPYQGFDSNSTFLKYLNYHFQQEWNHESASFIADEDKSCARIVSSTRPGMGKSLYIKRLVEKLQHDFGDDGCREVIIPLHGPKVNVDSLVEALCKNEDNVKPTIFHIDVAQSALRHMDSLLCSLIILQTICDSTGQLWRSNSLHLYVVEVTIPQDKIMKDIAKSTTEILNILPTKRCISPRRILNILRKKEQPDPLACMLDSINFKVASFQRVFQYLRRYEQDLTKFSYIAGSKEGNHLEFLNTLLNEFSLPDPSWSEVQYFINLLNEQLVCSEKSVYCKAFEGLKSFVVKFMITMAKDFCASSLKGEVAMETHETTQDLGTIEQHEIHDNKKWNSRYHPYLFFNYDQVTMTFVGFTVINCDIIDPISKEVVRKNAISKDLHNLLQENNVKFDENYRNLTKQHMIDKLGMVLGIEHPFDPDTSYVLTADNVIKMFAIQMKFRCNIPVVIMGETGCGKTHLIRYMCNLAAQKGGDGDDGDDCDGGNDKKNMLIMKVHGGVTEGDIARTINEAETLADHNRTKYDIDTIVFFDEANTTIAIGLIKEIMCDRRLNGKKISEDIKFIAACNPYRKHTDVMISKLEGAGLGFYVKSTEAQEKLGEIPLRQLVYRVFDLPSSMRPLVYDFGKLDDDTENDYTKQMVKDRCRGIKDISDEEKIAIVNVIKESQSYMRRRTDECSFVSLRDVERAMMVFRYFYENRQLFCDKIKEKAKGSKCVGRTTWALILSLSVCYHSRLQERSDFEMKIVKQFISPLDRMEDGTIRPLSEAQFQEEIKWCQDILLDHMKLGPNIARNAALRENVFMMTVCIQLKIPLFLVGKPGSSKSLAKSIVSDSLNQQTDPFLKEFTEVHMFSYQCSQLSTPESVIEVFTTAKRFQDDQKNIKFTSVVVLDEVGLAEDSPNLPLKVLHPLLEDGTEGNEAEDDILERDARVAFIGISNWALDPAKMNRGVMVTRGDPNKEELIKSAQQICSSKDNENEVKRLLDPYFEHLAKAYIDICVKQIEQDNKPFFGLRDFYSLIKMLYWMCDECGCQPTDEQLEHAIKRNFGGLKELNTYDIFKKHLSGVKRTETEPKHIVEDHQLHPDCTPLGLIEKSLSTKEVSEIGENRYLLFLTENYAALEVLKHKLHESVMTLSSTAPESSVGSSITSSIKAARRTTEPYVLFGSSFPRDKDYTQVCRNINQIKICMETGRTIILLNLENLYESLYDLLNQYYIKLGNTRYVDLGLQTHRVKCRVDNNFKLILIAEKETVYKKFPIPLINRLEKHFVLTETILLKWQKNILKRLNKWIEQFSVLKQYDFTKTDAFVGIQEDTPAAVIFQVTTKVKEELNLFHDSELAEHEEKILEKCYHLLLFLVSPDALIRLERTELCHLKQLFYDMYFEEQKHYSLIEFIKNQLNESTSDDGLSMQISTHSHLLSTFEVNHLIKVVGFTEQEAKCCLLQQFDTEQDFTKEIDPMFCESSEYTKRFVIIQCDSGHEHGNLVACTRYRIDDMREKAYRTRQKTNYNGVTHVIVLVHLPRGVGSDNTDAFSFVGFQGGSWISAHIDDVHETSDSELTLINAMSTPISQLFHNKCFKQSEQAYPEYAFNNYNSLVSKLKEGQENDASSVESTSTTNVKFTQFFSLPEPVGDKGAVVLCQRLQLCSQKVIAMIAERDDSKKGWGVDRLRILLEIIPKKPTFPLDVETFYGSLVQRILLLLKEREKIEESDWVLDEACKRNSLQCDGTFQNVLTRKFDNEIIPMFANILSFVDCYSNLEILLSVKKPLSVKQCLWFRLFNHTDICQFSYYNKQRQAEFNKLHETLRQDFVCEFPFFWVVKKLIDKQIDHYNGNPKAHSDIYQELMSTALAEALCIVSDDQIEEYCEYYIQDFLQSVHFVSHDKSNDEHEILRKALHAIANNSDLIYVKERSLLSCLIAVHIAYWNNRQHIMLFGQLTTLYHGVLGRIQRMNASGYNSNFVDIHLQAVDIVIEENQLRFKPGKTTKYTNQLLRLQKLKNVTNSILKQFEVTSCLKTDTTILTIRLKWNYQEMMKLFIEHILVHYTSEQQQQAIIITAATLQSLFKHKCNFSVQKTFENIQNTFNRIEKLPCTTSMAASAKNTFIKDVKRRFKDFLAEVISTLCFPQYHDTLEPELIDEFISIVLDQQKLMITSSGAKKKAPFSILLDVESSTAIRSFLLQLLLEYNIDEVNKHLNNYFHKSQNVETTVCSLSIQCLEDAIAKKVTANTRLSYNMQLLELLRDGYKVLKSSEHKSSAVTFEYLEAVAKIRYVCFSVAKLRLEMTNDCGTQSDSTRLMNQLQHVCQDASINTIDIGPGIFLVKQIARQHDPRLLDKLSMEKAKWVIPECLRLNDKIKEQLSDPFSVYDKEYTKLRKLVHEAAYCCEYNTLEKFIKTSMPKSRSRGPIAVLAAIYQVVTMSHAYGDARTVTKKDHEYFLSLLKNTDVFSKEIFTDDLINVGVILIQRSFCENLNYMKPSLSQSELLKRKITEVVVHTAIVFHAKKDLDIMKPFNNLLTSPESLKTSYIPTLPGAVTFNDSEKRALGGGYSRCPNDHVYLIDNSQEVEKKPNNMSTEDEEKDLEEPKPKETENSEKPKDTETVAEDLKKDLERTPKDLGEKLTCPISKCKKDIAQLPTIQDVDKDSAYTGYTLNDSSVEQMNNSSNQRGITPKSCAIIRALINACLTWTACINTSVTNSLVELCNDQKDTTADEDKVTDDITDMPSTTDNPDVEQSSDETITADNVTEYFWNRLETSIKTLAHLIEKSDDDACFLLHVILRNISTAYFQNNKIIEKEAMLETEVDRLKWENSFDLVFVNSMLKQEDKMKELRRTVLDYKSNDRDPLYYTIQDQRTVHSVEIHPHLWTYRPRITTDTLFQRLKYDDEFPILKYLSENDQMLRVTQYLPEIVKLQQHLCEMYQWKIDEVEAIEITVAMFIDKIESDFLKEEVHRQFNAVKKAWKIFEKHYGPGLFKDYISTDWDINSFPIAYLIPTERGPGMCSKTLIEELVKTHNAFLSHCDSVFKERRQTEFILTRFKVPTKYIQDCHLIQYELQLVSMILSNSYQLQRDQEFRIEFKALEKSFIDQFIHGRPMIKLDLPIFRFREDACIFDCIKQTKNIPENLKSEIISELKTIQSLRASLDTVEIIMGFLSSGHFDPSLKLRKFVTKSLKMEKKFTSKKAMQHCNLEHIISLWTILSVELAKKLLEDNFEPFEGLTDEYRLPITDPKEMRDLKEFLARDINLDEILEIFLKFIEMCVKRNSYIIKNNSILSNDLASFSNEFKKYEAFFPSELIVGQAVTVWIETAKHLKAKLTHNRVINK